MIIGIVTLFAMLFGGGSVDQFYIDKIDKGVKKYVVDKDRKKELAGYFKSYQTTVSEWNKTTKLELKEFKNRNLDRGASMDWYKTFFVGRTDVREEMMSKFIDSRLKIQELITDDEWDQIMALASGADQKQEEKQAKEERKNADKDMLKKLRLKTDENVTDAEARAAITLAWDNFSQEYKDIQEAYDALDVNNSEVLARRNATRAEFEAVALILIEIRAEALAAYLPMIEILKASTTDEGYEAIMKEFNKHLK